MPETLPALDLDVVQALGEEHGWPFYLADLARLDANVAALRRALDRCVATSDIGYSFKTNYLAAFIEHARHHGVLAEVVSELEFDYALDLGYTGPDIVVNGPIKHPSFLGRCLAVGAQVNIDSLEEADALSACARRVDRCVTAGVRVCTSFRGRSRFGLDLDDDDVVADLRRRLVGVEVVGAHCHAPGRRSAQSYADRLAHLARSFERLRPGLLPEYLDVGGGMMGSLPPDLAAQLSEPAATYDDYAAVLGSTLHDRYGSTTPRLVVEPGMGLLADAMSLFAPVVSVKRSSGQDSVVVAASVLDVKPLRGPVDPSTRVLHRGAAPLASGAPRRLPVGGNTCMEIDMLHSGLDTEVAVGDVVEFRNVGAYSISMRPNFIEPAPAVLEAASGAQGGNRGVTRVLRPRMTARTFGALYGGRP